jgi:hypothetical protein
MFAERRIGKPHRLVVASGRFSFVFGRIHGVFSFLVKNGMKASGVLQSR